jgi:hypothetical protein
MITSYAFVWKVTTIKTPAPSHQPVHQKKNNSGNKLSDSDVAGESHPQHFIR